MLTHAHPFRTVITDPCEGVETSSAFRQPLRPEIGPDIINACASLCLSLCVARLQVEDECVLSSEAMFPVVGL